MKFKKVTALALCVAMSATALAGCGSKAATTDSQTARQQLPQRAQQQILQTLQMQQKKLLLRQRMLP